MSVSKNGHISDMVKKISGGKKLSAQGQDRKKLHAKRLRLKHLHRDADGERAALRDLPASELPPASSSNAARQARSRLNITHPVDWQALHLKGSSERERSSDSNDESEVEN